MNEIQIVMPTLHAGQVAAYRMPGRFKAVRCGRRWGKTEMLSTIACDGGIKGEPIGIFAPDYKILTETYKAIHDMISPVIVSSSKVEGVIRTSHGGVIDFWTLNNPRAGRGRKYKKVLLDEVAFAGPDMMDIWQQAIKPTLLDYKGSATAFSTPNGANIDNYFYRICTEPEHGFVEYHAPTHTNPYLPADELAKLEKENHPLVYRQEYLAEFVDWSGAAFFSLDTMLTERLPVPYPIPCDQVFAVVDTAVKDGLEHDGTAVLYCAVNKIWGTKLTILDWDIIQISGDLLDQWLPTVQARCEELSILTKARYGNVGVWIEDKATGSVLIQQAQRKQLKVYAIDGDLTAMGKDGRALSVSSYVHQGDVKLSEYAYNKTTTYRNQTKNHFLAQVCGYRIGAKTPHQMDLLDTFCYSIAIALGDSEGY